MEDFFFLPTVRSFTRELGESQVRVELFNDIASYFKEIVEFPQEVTEGISDEQYIRNVVDALYQTRASIT